MEEEGEEGGGEEEEEGDDGRRRGRREAPAWPGGTDRTRECSHGSPTPPAPRHKGAGARGVHQGQEGSGGIGRT